MVDAGGVDDAGRVAEALAVERRGGHVQRLVVEGGGERALLEVAADDRHRVDRGDRRHAQAAERRDQAAPGRVGERQVVDRGREDVGDLLRDQLLGRRHADVDRLVEAADRGGGLLAERRVGLVADHELVGGARDLVDVAREPGVGLDRDRVRLSRLRAAEDDVGEPVAVAVVGQLAPELVDEQPAVREDQDALGAGGLDEAGGGDRLAGGGRMAEAVAPLGARVLRGRSGRLLLVAVSVVEREVVVVLVVLVGRAPRRHVRRSAAVAVLGGFWFAAISSVSMPGERVDLVAAQLGAGGEVRRLLRQHALEPEHQREAHPPLAATALAARLRSRRARRRARARSAVPGASTTAGSSSGRRNGSPAQASARRAAASMPSDASDEVGDCVSVSCMRRDTTPCRLYRSDSRVTPRREPCPHNTAIRRVCVPSALPRGVGVRLGADERDELRERDVDVGVCRPQVGPGQSPTTGRVSPARGRWSICSQLAVPVRSQLAG